MFGWRTIEIESQTSDETKNNIYIIYIYIYKKDTDKR